MIAEHSLQLRLEPLRMYLGGPGGTGKSYVIKALQQFFDHHRQSRQLQLTSYTGMAACNISGMTLHSTLPMKQNHKSGPSKATRNLIAMSEGIDYLFIDKVSMTGCDFLLSISEALTTAKGNTTAFRGMNVVFASDFAQLPPIGQKRLFSHLDKWTIAQGGTKAGQKTILRKLLWLSVTQVIILDKVMCQSGPDRPATRWQMYRCWLWLVVYQDTWKIWKKSSWKRMEKLSTNCVKQWCQGCTQCPWRCCICCTNQSMAPLVLINGQALG